MFGSKNRSANELIVSFETLPSLPPRVAVRGVFDAAFFVQRYNQLFDQQHKVDNTVGIENRGSWRAFVRVGHIYVLIFDLFFLAFNLFFFF